MYSRSLLFILISVFCFSLSAQESMRKKITAWYNEQRLVAADADKNAGLSLNEIQKYPDEFCYYLDKNNFVNTDKNKDGEIDKKELSEKYEVEAAIRERMEHQQLRGLNVEYGMLSLVDLKYLKKNPELVEILMRNNTWMEENAFYVQELLKSKAFIKKYPEIITSFNKNLRWLAFNPVKAQKVYRLRTVGTEFPELQAWRDNQNEFIRENPRLKESIFNTDVKK